jgi:hypothetical protein
MNYRLNRQHLKVDATAIRPRLDSDDKRVLVIYNVNIPATLTAAIDAIVRTERLLETDFAGADVLYQVTASFYLRNSQTDDERFWSGSFFTKGNSPAQLSGFERFDPATFARIVRDSMQHAEARLSVTGLDTVWSFHRLSSYIINVQCKVRSDHGVLEKRGLYDAIDRRLQITFDLP